MAFALSMIYCSSVSRYHSDSFILKTLMLYHTGNGIIEFPEFVDLMSRRSWGKQGTEEELSHAFQALDQDGAGHISAASIRHLLTNMGEKLTDEELDEMMREIPVDGDGMIAYDGKFDNFLFNLFLHNCCGLYVLC